MKKSKRVVRHWKVLAPKEFKTIKKALETYKDAKSPVGEVSRLTGRSYATIAMIHKCDSIEEFKAAQRAVKEAYTKPKAGMDAVMDAAKNMPTAPKPEETSDEETMLDVMKDIRDELRAINTGAQTHKRSLFGARR